MARKPSLLEVLVLGAGVALPSFFTSIARTQELQQNAQVSESKETKENAVYLDFLTIQMGAYYLRINETLEEFSNSPPSSPNDERFTALGLNLEWVLYTSKHINEEKSKGYDVGDKIRFAVDAARINAQALRGLVNSVVRYDFYALEGNSYLTSVLANSNKNFGIKPDNLEQIVIEGLFSENISDFRKGVMLVDIYDVKLPKLSQNQENEVIKTISNIIREGGTASYLVSELKNAGWDLKLGTDEKEGLLKESFYSKANETNFVEAFNSVWWQQRREGLTNVKIHLTKKQIEEFKQDAKAYFHTFSEPNYKRVLSAIEIANKMGTPIYTINIGEKEIRYIQRIANELDEKIGRYGKYSRWEDGIVLGHFKKLFPDIYKQFKVTQRVERWMADVKVLE